MRDTLHATAADALYRIGLSNAKLPLTIIAVRQVTDGACQADWIASRDTVRYYISRESEQENPLWICEEQLPYDYTYTLADGSEKVLHFATEKDTVAVNDVNALGCALRLKFYILLRGKASIDVTRELYACQTTDSVIIGINSPVGSLRQYTLATTKPPQKRVLRAKTKPLCPTISPFRLLFHKIRRRAFITPICNFPTVPTKAFAPAQSTTSPYLSGLMATCTPSGAMLFLSITTTKTAAPMPKVICRSPHSSGTKMVNCCRAQPSRSTTNRAA